MGANIYHLILSVLPPSKPNQPHHLSHPNFVILDKCTLGDLSAQEILFSRVLQYNIYYRRPYIRILYLFRTYELEPDESYHRNNKFHSSTILEYIREV